MIHLQDSLNHVWHEALLFDKSVRLRTPKSDSLIYKGIKIEKTESKIVIYNTRMSRDFYREITEDQYNLFVNRGFLLGVYSVCVSNYRTILDVLDRKMKSESEKSREMILKYRNSIVNKFIETLELLRDENRP